MPCCSHLRILATAMVASAVQTLSAQVPLAPQQPSLPHLPNYPARVTTMFRASIGYVVRGGISAPSAREQIANEIALGSVSPYFVRHESEIALRFDEVLGHGFELAYYNGSGRSLGSTMIERDGREFRRHSRFLEDHKSISLGWVIHDRDTSASTYFRFAAGVNRYELGIADEAVADRGSESLTQSGATVFSRLAIELRPELAVDALFYRWFKARASLGYRMAIPIDRWSDEAGRVESSIPRPIDGEFYVGLGVAVGVFLH
jgi:hypothetical protein